MSIRTNALHQAIKILTALKVSYAVFDEEGNKYGNLEVVQEKKRAPTVFPRGDIRSHVLPLIKDLEIGDVATVDAGIYGLERVRSNICAWFIGKYGSGSCTTSIDHDTNTIEVLRIF